MKKQILSLLVLMGLIMTGTALAVKPVGPSAVNGLTKGNSSVQHLYLYEKDPVTWEIIEEGAWGKLTCGKQGFVATAHGLEPGTDYALIVYDPDVWSGQGPILAEGTANKGGNIQLSGEMIALTDAKIWLVLRDDVDENGVMIAWNPTEYLFEYNLVSCIGSEDDEVVPN